MHGALSAEAYAEVLKRLAPDGALRDLLVLETTVDDWQCLIDFVQMQRVQIAYKEGDITLPTPTSARSCFSSGPNRHSRLMSFRVAGMDFNCHFFALDQIEIDIDPRQIDGRPAVESLFDFMCSLGRRLQKDVLLADEGGISAASPFWNSVICSYEAASGQLRTGCEPRPLLMSNEERAAIEALHSWTRAFWARLKLLVRGWREGLEIIDTGDTKSIGSVQLWLLTSDQDAYVVAGTPSDTGPDRWNNLGTVSINTRETAPAEAATRTSVELKVHIMKALDRT